MGDKDDDGDLWFTSRGVPRSKLGVVLHKAVIVGKAALDVQKQVQEQLDALKDDGNLSGGDRFWVACVYFFGIPKAAFRNTTRAEMLLTHSIETDSGLRACPDCAMLWGVGYWHGVFQEPRNHAVVFQLARAHGLPLQVAAYVASAENGGSLGRLAWGQLRARGIIAAQHEQVVSTGTGDTNETWPFIATWSDQITGAGTVDDSSRQSCLESLEAVTPVATNAMTFQYTAVPQPVDLGYLQDMRSDDRRSFALADQLAADGVPEGVATKAEMLFYGKDRVVPGRGEDLTGSSTWSTYVILLVGALILLALCGAPSVAHRLVACRRRKARQECPPRRQLGERNVAPAHEAAGDSTTRVDADHGNENGHQAVLCTFALRFLFVVAAVCVWSCFGPASAPLGSLERDEAAAADLFEEAARSGYWGAAYALAMIKLESPNRTDATPWLNQVVEQGDDSARALAKHFQHKWGLGAEQNAARAEEFLEQAAELGEPNAAMLLAEARAREVSSSAASTNDTGKTPEHNVTQAKALEQYRAAANAGQLPARYNIAVLLLKQLEVPPQDMPLEKCLEIRAELEAVATDLDPTVRLLFAHALRSWESGDIWAALQVFAMLSEAGVEKAHRSVAQLWHGQVESSWPRLARTLAEGVDVASQNRSEQTKGSILNLADSTDSTKACTQAAHDANPTFHVVHQGMFCCPSGDCKSPEWLVNTGGVEATECAQLCASVSGCRFMTVYSATGYCQLSTNCIAKHAADDKSASTFELRWPTTFEHNCVDASLSPMHDQKNYVATSREQWCWEFLFSTEASLARNCAAVYYVRAASITFAGSAREAARVEAESAALQASGLLQQIGLFRVAHAWACHAATTFSSSQGRILCAELAVESWGGHAPNLSLAVSELRELVQGEGTVAVAAYVSLAILYFRFVKFASLSCHVNARGVSCPNFHDNLLQWGGSNLQLDQASFEFLVSAILVFVVIFTIVLSRVILLALRRVFIGASRRSDQ